MFDFSVISGRGNFPLMLEIVHGHIHIRSRNLFVTNKVAVSSDFFLISGH